MNQTKMYFNKTNSDDKRKGVQNFEALLCFMASSFLCPGYYDLNHNSAEAERRRNTFMMVICLQKYCCVYPVIIIAVFCCRSGKVRCRKAFRQCVTVAPAFYSCFLFSYNHTISTGAYNHTIIHSYQHIIITLR